MMRPKAALTVTIIAGFLLLSALSAGSLEIGGLFEVGNQYFRPDRPSTDTSFPGTDYLFGGSLYLRADFLEHFQVEAGYSRDFVLRNVLYSLLQYRVDYFSLGIGMFVGFFNSGSSTLNSGITTSISLELPGVVFVSLRSDNSLSGSLIESGDFSQRLIDLSVGFYVRNAICSLILTTKEYAEMQGTTEIIDHLIKYSFKADIFQKNVPFRLVLTFAYQTLDKKYLDGVLNPADGLNSIMLGTEVDITIGRHLELIFGIDSSLFTVGTGQLSSISYAAFAPYLFQAYTGFRLKFEQPARNDRQNL
jgi:hypothetical protein